jgi:short-subunit dehydrogenase
MRTLRGKVVLVTGAASGIGRCLAMRFAQAGSLVIITDLDGDRAVSVAAEVQASGGLSRTYALDVTDAERVRQLRTRLRDETGGIDVLVNNAGVVHGGAFLDVALERHLATFMVNAIGVTTMTHVFLGDLLARHEAHVVNMASASSLVGLPFGASYASSKWAVLGLSESLRLELKALGHSHVGVTAVCPSYVSTGMFDGAAVPRLTRILTPDRLASKVVAAVRANRACVLTPWLVAVTPLLRGVLPRPVFDAVARVFGVSSSMVSWRGRGTKRH